MQKEMPFYRRLEPPKFASQSVVNGFKNYREAVIWVWQNREANSANERVDQSLCANSIGLPTPQMSRCVNPTAKGPMLLPPDFIVAFENFCGSNAISQFLARRKQFTLFEQIQEERRHAA